MSAVYGHPNYQRGATSGAKCWDCHERPGGVRKGHEGARCPDCWAALGVATGPQQGPRKPLAELSHNCVDCAAAGTFRYGHPRRGYPTQLVRCAEHWAPYPLRAKRGPKPKQEYREAATELAARYPCQALPDGAIAAFAREKGLDRKLIWRVMREERGYGKAIPKAQLTPQTVCACGKPMTSGSTQLCRDCNWITLPCGNCGTPVRRGARRLASDLTKTHSNHGRQKVRNQGGEVYCNGVCRARGLAKEGRLAKQHGRKSTLTEEAVVAMRAAYAAKAATAAELAARYGTTAGNIHQIVHGKTWQSTGGPITPIDPVGRGERRRLANQRRTAATMDEVARVSEELGLYDCPALDEPVSRPASVLVPLPQQPVAQLVSGTPDALDDAAAEVLTTSPRIDAFVANRARQRAERAYRRRLLRIHLGAAAGAVALAVTLWRRFR